MTKEKHLDNGTMTFDEVVELAGHKMLTALLNGEPLKNIAWSLVDYGSRWNEGNKKTRGNKK